MRLSKITQLAVILCLIFTASTAFGAYELVWSDEFDGGMNPEWWLRSMSQPPNDELQAYRPENVTIENGNMVITAKRESFEGKQYTSGRAETYRADETGFSAKYGKIEARIKLPKAIGLWPAWWTLGTSIWPSGSAWPECGEIDIFEHKNDDFAVTGGCYYEVNNGVAHWPGSSSWVWGYSPDTEYHVYGIIWTPLEIVWYVDDETNVYRTSWDVASPQMTPMNIVGGINDTEEFHAPHFLLLNVAVGGGAGTEPLPEWQESKMYIDWVRVYQEDYPTSETNCSDGIDEDYDGDIDCYDADCQGGPDCPGYCGDGTCDPGENCNTCSGDCISRTIGAPSSRYCCGDGVCEGAENITNCEVDCGGPYCGDGTCDPGEDACACSEDCGAPPAEICDNGDDDDCDGLTDCADSDCSCPQLPYYGTPQAIPGQIEAEDFDIGVNGAAYYDATAGNAGGQYRTDVDVDIEACAEGGYDVGWLAANEWMDYQVDVATAGTYTIEARVASAASGGNFHIEFDGVDKTGTITVPVTGDWQAWTTVASTASLSSGAQEMTFVKDNSADEFNISYFNIIVGGSSSYCGDGTCDAGEDSCNCASDCGAPPSSETDCADGDDEDCDGYTDCLDIDCDGDPACPDCAAVGEYCEADTDCCSGNCFERKNYCKS